MVMQLAVNEATVAKLEQVARAKETTTQRLAEQALLEFLRNEERKLMQREMQAFAGMHDELLTTYPSEFVAVHQGRLIDHDRDQLALYQRVEKRYPNAAVLIKQVLVDAEEVYSFRSPRLDDAS
jgi:hypothetical protein